jgi:hypothetical protein
MERNPEYYHRDLIKPTFLFDGKDNLYSKTLIEYFNSWIVQQPGFENLKFDENSSHDKPKNIIWIDASQDGLPATSEACRITGEGTVVNTREQLTEQLKEYPGHTLLLSHCVKKTCYDIELSRIIDASGSVTSPGPLTAPGSIFSDKLKTYDMLSKNRTDWDLVAKYFNINPENRSPYDVAKAILDTVDSDQETDKFFVKPTEGGGGLGGFRLMKITHKGEIHYIIPDLSRVSGEFNNPSIARLTVDPHNPDVINELWWLYERFNSIAELKKNYIHVDIKNKKDLVKLLKNSSHKNILSREEALGALTDAIEKFELKFKKRYHPLLCHYIDFGTWGLRAHYRLTTKGIQIETIYARLFQIRFEEDGIGYIGSDNISNKQTGELEIGRLVPVNNIMINAIGGEENLYNILLKGAGAMKMLIETLPERLHNKIPVRVQFDLAPVSGIIGEGNADTSRGFCLAQDWQSFMNNTNEWLKDSISYYNYKKSQDNG